MDEVQVITDALAVQLGRAVYVEDAAFRPLAASAQVGHIDDARIAAVLARRPTAAHLQYCQRPFESAHWRPAELPTDGQ